MIKQEIYDMLSFKNTLHFYIFTHIFEHSIFESLSTFGENKKKQCHNSFLYPYATSEKKWIRQKQLLNDYEFS